jgi:hypothetical protein
MINTNDAMGAELAPEKNININQEGPKNTYIIEDT